MNKISLLLASGFFCLCPILYGQQAAVTTLSDDETVLKSLPRLTLPPEYGTRPLPAAKDNSRIKYFSGVYNQTGWSCNQAGSIWTMFTYEINYLRALNSLAVDNQYNPMSIFNLLNQRNGFQGVTYFDSWKVIQANGIPGNADYPTNNLSQQTWMTGYDRYYHAMKNRVDQVYAIDVGSEEGLLTLKHWLNDHLEGSQVGGLANFQIGSGNMQIKEIPLHRGLAEEGSHIVTKYDPAVGHCMTFIGWNDSVRYDVNEDGKYTNNIDINGDNVVNMKDWEIGAMLVLNSWGAGWEDGGKVWVMDRLLAESSANGGIWNNAAMVVVPKKTYNPLLTVRTKIRYNLRNHIKIQVGVSSDLAAHDPDKTIDFACFNFEGGDLPMQGFSDVNSDLIEIGLDITPLINYIPDNGQAKIFLDVIQKSSDALGAGQVESFSVMDYTNGSHEFINTDGKVTIERNTTTRLTVPVSIRIARPKIMNEELPEANVNEPYRAQLEADGTTGPYRYCNPACWYNEQYPDDPSTDFTSGTKIFHASETGSRVMDLPFSFPFYGTDYKKITVMTDGGIVMGQNLVTYPYVIFPSNRLYQNPGIYPFFSTLYYSLDDNQVTMEADANQATIRWKASVDAGGNESVEFAVVIKPDGSIRMDYGTMKVTHDISWISGISKGDNKEYHLMDNYYSGIISHSAVTLEKLGWPAWLSLGSNGDLKGTPGQSGSYVLPFHVTDWLGITGDQELTLKVNGGSGITDYALTDQAQLWPNPVTDDCWMEIKTARAGKLTLEILDLTGRRLLSKVFAAQAGVNTFHYTDVQSLTNGMYVYKLSGVLSAQGKLIKK